MSDRPYFIPLSSHSTPLNFGKSSSLFSPDSCSNKRNTQPPTNIEFVCHLGSAYVQCFAQLLAAVRAARALLSFRHRQLQENGYLSAISPDSRKHLKTPAKISAELRIFCEASLLSCQIRRTWRSLLSFQLPSSQVTFQVTKSNS
jgi:hypothetical protein